MKIKRKLKMQEAGKDTNPTESLSPDVCATAQDRDTTAD